MNGSMSDAPPPPGSMPAAWQWLTGALGVGLATVFNVLLPAVSHVAPFMAFHLAMPVVAWASRSLRVAWTAVFLSAVIGDVWFITPFGAPSLAPGQIGAALAFILIQGAFTLSIVLLRSRMGERDLLLEQLGTERDRLLSLLAQAPIALVTYRGPDLVHEFVSPGAQQLGQRPMVGRSLREVFADLEGQGLLQRIEGVYRTGDPLVLAEQHVRLRRDDGHVEDAYLDATYTPLRDPSGRVEGVLGCSVDVTARVQARLQLERSELQLRRLSEAGLLGIAELRGDRIIGANGRLLEMLGYPPGAGVPEGGIRWRELTPPELASADAGAILEAEAIERADPFERQLLRRDGTRLWILAGVALIDRESSSGVAFVIDITAQKEAERALQEAHQFEQRLLGIVSHDLRNPLASIRLGVDLLARSDLSAHQLRTVTRMVRSADRMHQLVAGLLDLTRLRAGQQLPVAREQNNMHLLVERAVEEVSVVDPGRVSVTGHGDGTGEWDTIRVGQALGNLLGNALQHSPAGSPVTVAVEGDPARVQVSIHNLGPPIAPEQQATLFEPFRRGVNPGALDGSVGLGLYIAWHVAEAHGGTIEVNSPAEGGTTFRLILPKRAPGTTVGAPGREDSTRGVRVPVGASSSVSGVT